jgi:hypothetical protein
MTHNRPIPQSPNLRNKAWSIPDDGGLHVIPPEAGHGNAPAGHSYVGIVRRHIDGEDYDWMRQLAPGECDRCEIDSYGQHVEVFNLAGVVVL